MRRDTVYENEIQYLIHCIMSRGMGESFVGYLPIVVFIGMKYQIN